MKNKMSKKVSKYLWFIFGMCLFFTTLAMTIIHYRFIDSLSEFFQWLLFIPIALGLFGGSWMIAHSLFK